MIDRHAHPHNLKGLAQVATTLLPLTVLWAGLAASGGVSHWLGAGIVALMTLFLLRAFTLMHECGHGSLFQGARLNQICGFVLGVVCGMPAYVWSQHHRYHHTNNGNWAKYRGPLSIVSVDVYAAMGAWQQRRYRNMRALWLAPLGGFLYLIFNPRVTFLKGSVSLAVHLVQHKIAQPDVSFRVHAQTFSTRYWTSSREYWHMFWNNAALMLLWITMAWLLGPLLFFVCYTISLSLAGAAGLVLFTVQHNFEHAYASDNHDWDYHAAVIGGTSFLELPRWLNWLTVNMGYHHIHHLSASIPNYCLAACHDEYQHLFTGVTRIRLWHIPHALQYILWDIQSRRLVSIAELTSQQSR